MTARGDTAARELGLFLRGRRERLSPPAGQARRRTPGLRREEVAERAGMSVDYVVRLEQGRDLHPSPELLEALCAALQLTADERAYVVELALRRREPGPATAAPELDRPSPAARLVHDLSPLPAMLLDHRLDYLAWNREAAALMLDFGAVAPERRNSMELCLFDLRLSGFYRDRDAVLAEGVADLRAAWASHPDDARLGELIEGWCARSPEFAQCWEQRDVRVQGRGTKRLRHPEVGPLDVEFEVLHPMTDPRERLVIYRASDPASRDALDRLTAGVRAAG